MAGLVLELQADAMDDGVSVMVLLRKARAISVKLGVQSINEWLRSEMEGYTNANIIPDYRRVTGKLECFNPYVGYIPLGSNSPDMDQQLSQRSLSIPLSEIYDVALGEGHSVWLGFPPHLSHQLQSGMEFAFEPYLKVSVGQFRKIISSVRDRILNFALDLEQQGIIGDGMTFSKDERQAASHISYSVNIENMHGSQVQQGTSNSSQNLVNTVDAQALRILLEKLEPAVQQITEPNARAQFSSDLQTVAGQMGAPAPKVSIVRECLISIRSVLEGAGGNLTAEYLPLVIPVLASLSS